MIKSTFNRKEYMKKYRKDHAEESYQRFLSWVDKNKERRREIARDSYHRRKKDKVNKTQPQ
jgi:hypothetical protein